MTRVLLTATLLATVALPALASDDDRRLDTTRRAEITTTLTAQGYDVRRIESDDGLYEVYAMKDGQRLELYLNDALEIVRSERDD